MRTWTFRETGKIRNVFYDEWFVNVSGEPSKWTSTKKSWEKYPILTLEVHEGDPMEGIRAILKEWEAKPIPTDSLNTTLLYISDFKEAMKKVVEGK